MMRDILQCGHQAYMSEINYSVPPNGTLRPAGRPDFANDWVTTYVRDGSVVGSSCCVQIQNHTSNGTINVRVREYDPSTGTWSTLQEITSPTITGNGVFKWGETQTAGTGSFSADKPLVVEIKQNGLSKTFEYRPIIIVELELDE